MIWPVGKWDRLLLQVEQPVYATRISTDLAAENHRWPKLREDAVRDRGWAAEFWATQPTTARAGTP